MNGLTQAYFAKTSITHNKYLTPQFLGDNDPISVKSAVQILHLDLEYTFLVLNFFVTDLCNSSSTSSTFAFKPDPVFLSNMLHSVLANPL